jgi:hypothetical protein
MSRIEVLKTYKIYIGGQFPRTESGRYYALTNRKNEPVANVSLSSRKDFRNAVVAARNAAGGWSSRAAFNRGQILYRIAEMLEGRKDQFIGELITQGATPRSAAEEVTRSIDRLVYYSGWCDKYQQLFGTVNPVASSHFNFSVPEPTGVVAVIAPEESALLGLVSVIAPVIAGGNTCVVLASNSLPLSSITFAEVLATSDLPGGVVNILTGYHRGTCRSVLEPHGCECRRSIAERMHEEKKIDRTELITERQTSVVLGARLEETCSGESVSHHGSAGNEDHVASHREHRHIRSEVLRTSFYIAATGPACSHSHQAVRPPMRVSSRMKRSLRSSPQNRRCRHQSHRNRQRNRSPKERHPFSVSPFRRIPLSLKRKNARVQHPLPSPSKHPHRRNSIRSKSELSDCRAMFCGTKSSSVSGSNSLSGSFTTAR